MTPTMGLLALLLVALASGLLVVSGSRDWRPSLTQALLVAAGLRLAMFVIAHDVAPYDLVNDFRIAGENVLAHQDPTLNSRPRGWNHLPTYGFLWPAWWRRGEHRPALALGRARAADHLRSGCHRPRLPAGPSGEGRSARVPVRVHPDRDLRQRRARADGAAVPAVRGRCVPRPAAWTRAARRARRGADSAGDLGEDLAGALPARPCCSPCRPGGRGCGCSSAQAQSDSCCC
jgi:hypothetical protein